MAHPMAFACPSLAIAISTIPTGSRHSTPLQFFSETNNFGSSDYWISGKRRPRNPPVAKKKLQEKRESPVAGKANANWGLVWRRADDKRRKGCDILAKALEHGFGYEVNNGDPGSANHLPLSPMGFVERCAIVYGDSISVVYNNTYFTWSQTYERCRRLASALCSLNILPGDIVSVVAPNVPALYEMHFGVPMAGGVLNCVNIRLDARTMGAQFRHCQPKLVFADYEFVKVVTEALRQADIAPPVIEIQEMVHGKESPATTYEGLLKKGDPRFQTRWPEDEWQPIVLNYTSGTTSAPKGVVHSHRGLCMLSMDNSVTWRMKPKPVYLWTLPMFHANGWCFTWTIAALGGTNVCLRKFDARIIYSAIQKHRVTHLCGAPVVLAMIANASSSDRMALPGRVEILTAGAPPPAAVLYKTEELGFSVTHGYGLTETGGLVITCAWKAEWDGLPAEEKARMKARQGVRVLSLAEMDVKDPNTMVSVPRDGVSIGEVMVKGNTVMRGYLNDEKGTARAMEGGWLHTGDVGVIHPDGYLEIKDRSKDVIISGGENISSVAVESVLYSHPNIIEAAVVARPHPLWGETPCAFVYSRNVLSEEEVISFCRERLPRYMVPKTVVFMELPKTSTGKIQKFVLREMARCLPSPESPPPINDTSELA